MDSKKSYLINIFETVATVVLGRDGVQLFRQKFQLYDSSSLKLQI